VHALPCFEIERAHVEKNELTQTGEHCKIFGHYQSRMYGRVKAVESIIVVVHFWRIFCI